MELLTPPIEVALAGVRSLKTIALADGSLDPLERRLIESIQRYVLKTDFALDDLEAITPGQLARAVESPTFRERILFACTLTALIDGEASENEAAVLEAYAQAFEISSPAVYDVRRLIDRHLLTMRIDIARRSFIGQRARAYFADQGIRGVARTLRALLGIENPSLAEQYRRLEQFPQGTLGREYFEFVRRNGFALPGEKNGAPEVIVFHDCLHVLADYGTESLEETQIASFQAGVLKRDAVHGLLFMLAQFHLGVQITPVTGAERMVADPDLMLLAFVRGTKVTRDLCVDWKPQDDFERPVDELRRTYNIEPRVRSQPVTSRAS